MTVTLPAVAGNALTGTAGLLLKSTNIQPFPQTTCHGRLDILHIQYWCPARSNLGQPWRDQECNPVAIQAGQDIEPAVSINVFSAVIDRDATTRGNVAGSTGDGNGLANADIGRIALRCIDHECITLITLAAGFIATVANVITLTITSGNNQAFPATGAGIIDTNTDIPACDIPGKGLFLLFCISQYALFHADQQAPGRIIKFGQYGFYLFQVGRSGLDNELIVHTSDCPAWLHKGTQYLDNVVSRTMLQRDYFEDHAFCSNLGGKTNADHK